VLTAGAASVITSIRLGAGTAEGITMDGLTAKFRT
jgi:hypothetical protein